MLRDDQTCSKVFKLMMGIYRVDGEKHFPISDVSVTVLRFKIMDKRFRGILHRIPFFKH